MSRSFLTSAATVALVACSATPQPRAALPTASPRAEDSPVSCSIRTTPTRHGVLIEALADAHQPAAGEYQLIITKHGRGGSSDISQGGAFEAAAQSTLTLGSAEIGLDRGDRFHAVLTLSDAQGQICQEERQS